MMPLGDAAVIVRFGDSISPDILVWIKALADQLRQNPFPGLIEFVPAYTNLTIFYNPWLISEKGKYPAYDQALKYIQARLKELKPAIKPSFRLVQIPVCYGDDYGPDLNFVAAQNNLKPEEVIRIHTGATYLVYMIGFAPGFPYMGGMSEKIATPRKQTPRNVIPVGSVGIAGNQTGIYSLPTPGGWQLIGRTPLSLFNQNRQPASLLQAGDQVKFIPITKTEYEERAHAY